MPPHWPWFNVYKQGLPENYICLFVHTEYIYTGKVLTLAADNHEMPGPDEPLNNVMWVNVHGRLFQGVEWWAPLPGKRHPRRRRWWQRYGL